MQNTKIFILCAILLTALVVPATAETVMLFTDRPSGFGDEKSSIHYIEDGIMEVFFDAGHIIFNSTYQSTEEIVEEKDVFADYPAFRIAKAGGAMYILTVQLRFTEDEEDLLPVAAAYALIDLETEANLAGGTVMLERPDDWKEKEPYELVQGMGRRLGREALKGL